MNMPEKINRYIKKEHKNVDGWLSEIAASIIVKLADIQNEKNIHGPVCEIGVHHGKLFILLHLLTQNDELSVAWDLFEDRQVENVDASGSGNKAIFIKNLTRHKCNLKKIRICTENSMNLTEEKILQTCGGNVRLFSIDGGHTSDITYNDMLLAVKTIAQGGLIILDDYFNYMFPGVSEGVCKLIFEGKVKLYPVVIAGNKFIFTNEKEYATYYMDSLMTFGGNKFIKNKTMIFGENVLTIIHNDIPVISLLVKTRLWKKIRTRLPGKIIRKLYYDVNRYLRSLM